MNTGLRLGLVIGAVIWAGAWSVGQARATDPAPAPTTIQIVAVGAGVVGEPLEVSARLLTATGHPLAEQRVRVYLGPYYVAQGQTDATGLARVAVHGFAAGDYPLLIFYGGALESGYTAAQVSGQVHIAPAQMTLAAVPPLAGIQFVLGEKVFVTDAQGLAHIEIERPGPQPLKVQPPQPTPGQPPLEIAFERWNDEVFTAEREIRAPFPEQLEAGFILQQPTWLAFTDPAGQAIDPARVTAVTFKGAGHTYSYSHTGPYSLPANRLAKRPGRHLESQPITYYFQSVTIDGSNVINQGQQRFVVGPDRIWDVSALMYTATLRPRDALFGFPVGSAIRVEYPDGRIEMLAFDKKSQTELQLTTLARGAYKATVVGIGGMAPPTPLALTRDQSVELLVLSYLDMSVIGGILGAIALAIFFIGRPRVFFALRSPAALWQLIRETLGRELRDGRRGWQTFRQNLLRRARTHG